MKNTIRKMLCGFMAFGLAFMLCRGSVLARTVANSTFGSSYTSILSSCLYGSNTMYQVNLKGYEYNPATGEHRGYNKSLSKSASSGETVIITHRSDDNFVFEAKYNDTRLTATFYSGMGSGSLYYYATVLVS